MMQPANGAGTGGEARPKETASEGVPSEELDGIVRAMLQMAGVMPTSIGAPHASSRATPLESLTTDGPTVATAMSPEPHAGPGGSTGAPPSGLTAAEPVFYFMRAPGSRPAGGMTGPSHPIIDGTGSGPQSSATLPGSETAEVLNAGVAQGQTPNFISLDLVDLRPGGRDVPLAGPHASWLSASEAIPASVLASPGMAESPQVPLAGDRSPTPQGHKGWVHASNGANGVSPVATLDWSEVTARLVAGNDPSLLRASSILALPDDTPESPLVAAAAAPFYFLPAGAAAGSTPRRESSRGPRVRDDFPILSQKVNDGRLVWLDSGATTQKPHAVIDGEAEFYRRDNSNVHRGAHALARRATDAYEKARDRVQRFLGAESSDEIVFVRGTTEAINLVAQAYGRHVVRSGDEILVTHLEHHSNIVPWQLLCQQTGAVLRVAPVDEFGDLIVDEYERLLGPRTRIVAMTQVSNVTGTLVPVAPLVAMAHRHGAVVLVDGAQAVAHLPVDVKCLDADFYVFSGHKIYGPTGIGALYGKRALLDAMPPWQGGGSMITDTTFERSLYAEPPAKFEAGTGNIAGAVGLGIALDYLDRLGRPDVALHEQALVIYALHALRSVPGLRMIGAPRARVGALSFLIDGHDPLAVARALDQKGIAVRAGHHCAQPIHRRFGVETSVRASLGVYNEQDDIDALVAALRSLDKP